MTRLVYWLVWLLLKLLQSLPLLAAAWLGRMGGALAYWLDSRHRRVALNNLTAAFAGEMEPGQIRALAREHFRRLGENYCAAVKTTALSDAQLEPHLELVGFDSMLQAAPFTTSRIVAIGHFGNFELYARAQKTMPQFRLATTYRALKQPLFDQLLLDLRTRHGCLVFERRRDAQALLSALTQQPLALGLLADQHAGGRGVWMPFLGRLCSTTRAPAVYALRYKLPLFVSICFRTGLARWRIEIVRQIPLLDQGKPRAVSAITEDINQTLEEAVRRDPANWFWVHQRWKLPKKKVAHTRLT